jgi:hypothetical protein
MLNYKTAFLKITRKVFDWCCYLPSDPKKEICHDRIENCHEKKVGLLAFGRPGIVCLGQYKLLSHYGQTGGKS